MEKIRIGNDIKISWSIFVESSEECIPYNLNGKRFSLYMVCGKVRKAVTDCTVEENTLCWLFRGSEQKYKGFYDLLLVENEGENGMHTFDLHGAFALVDHSCEAGGTSCHPGLSVCHLELKGGLYIRNDVPLYDSEIPKTVRIPSAVGGIAEGTYIKELEGRSISSVLDDLLYPPIPTYRKPEVTGFCFDGGLNSIYVEVGSKVLVPSAAGLDRGEWDGLNAGLPYAGEIDRVEYSFYIFNGKEYLYYNSTDALPSLDGLVYFQNSSCIYSVYVYYKDGPVPVNSRNEEVPDLAAKASTVSLMLFAMPIWPSFASTADASAKQPVVKLPIPQEVDNDGFVAVFELQPSGTLPQVFKTPQEVKSIYEYHDIMGEMVKVDMDRYTHTTGLVDINGIEQMYHVYTYNGPERGAVRVAIKYTS